MSTKVLLKEYAIPQPTQSRQRPVWYLVALAATTFVLYGFFTCCQQPSVTDYQPKVTFHRITYPKKEIPAEPVAKPDPYTNDNGADITSEEALWLLRDITERSDQTAMLGTAYDRRRAVFCEKLSKQLQTLSLSTTEESKALIRQYYPSGSHFLHAMLRLHSDRRGICSGYRP